MEALREAQREKWLRAKQDPEGPTEAGSSASQASPSQAAPEQVPGAASSSGMQVNQAVSPSGSDSNTQKQARRVHVLPIGAGPGSSNSRRLELLAPVLRDKRGKQERLKTGMCLQAAGQEFVIVKIDPEESILTPETDFYVDGDPVVRFEKVQFICLWDFQSTNVGSDPSELFNNYISPYFRSVNDSGPGAYSIVALNEVLKIFDLEFQVLAVEPSPPEIGIVDTNTVIFVDWDGTPEFQKIHIVPFQDTLPHAYEFDVFNDYLKPYLTRNKHLKFNTNDQFTYQGVQFKVVCCEPSGPARIGRNTTIYCEGVLHPSLRNLLPPDLLEQLSHLPPGLQMLLLNTEALAGGYEERLMEVQEMLTRRRGMADETIAQVEQFTWDSAQADAPGTRSQEQCMVCLAEFSNGEDVRRLPPCGHVFHSSCIVEWLRRCTDCPICKANVDRAVRRY